MNDVDDIESLLSSSALRDFQARCDHFQSDPNRLARFIANVREALNLNSRRTLAPCDPRPLARCWWRWESFLEEVKRFGGDVGAAARIVHDRAQVRESEYPDNRDYAARLAIGDALICLDLPKGN